MWALQNKIYRLTTAYGDVIGEHGEVYNIPTRYSETDYGENFTVGYDSYTNNEAQFKSELMPFNLETQAENSASEGAANSIINTKNLTITFNEKYGKEKEFNNYLFKTILPYLKQLIPSTTIFEIKIDGEGADYTCQKIAQISNGLKNN